MLPQRKNKAIAKRIFANKVVHWLVVLILFFSLSSLPTWAQNISDEIQGVRPQYDMAIKR